MSILSDLSICKACGTQFDAPLSEHPVACNICDDPRQYIPAALGQQWTSLKQMAAEGYKNHFHPDSHERHMTSITTEPKFGIGERCVLIETGHGNVLWDCMAWLDERTIHFIKSKGGLKAIVISHPHYYTTHMEWANAFDCPVHLAADDAKWLYRGDADRKYRVFIDGPTGTAKEILPSVTAIKAGGHFPGSLLLHWEKELFIADTIMTIPSGLYHIDRPTGTSSFSFMWSIPNMIPLNPDEILGIWKSVKPFDFQATHGAFVGTDIRHNDVKKRILDSMKIQVRREGYDSHDLLNEST